MATLSITIPDAIVAKLGAACKADLGPDGVGITNAQAAKQVAIRALKSAYRRFSLGVDIASQAATAQTAAQTARTAEATARAALQTAESTVNSQVNTDFAGVS